MAKSWVDQLTAVSKPVDDDDLISYIVSGVNPSLNAFITTRGVARNTDLGGPGCNRDIPNIIFKSIGYKIINFLILLYT